MNINERKHMTVSPLGSQAIADSHFVHSWMDNGHRSKLCSSKCLVKRFERRAMWQNRSSINCLQNGIKVALNMITTING